MPNIKSQRKDLRFQGKERIKLKKKIILMRESYEMSFATIAKALGIGWDFCYRLYQENKGELVNRKPKE